MREDFGGSLWSTSGFGRKHIWIFLLHLVPDERYWLVVNLELLCHSSFFWTGTVIGGTVTSLVFTL